MGGFPKPAGSYNGLERDERGHFTGKGVVTGLGMGEKTNTVKINVNYFVKHWPCPLWSAGRAPGTCAIWSSAMTSLPGSATNWRRSPN